MEHLANHKKITLALVGAATVLAVAVFVGVGPGTLSAPAEIPPPKDGFLLAFGDYRAMHLGDSSIPDGSGRLTPVAVVLEQYAATDARLTTLLFLTPDLRWIVAGHSLQCDIAPTCSEIFAWPKGQMPWLFGLSPYFGQMLPEDRLHQADDEACRFKLDLRNLTIPKGVTPTRSSAGGLVCLDGQGRPIAIQTPEGLELAHQEVDSDVERPAVPRGRPLALPDPRQYKDFPSERLASYSEFPWAEALPLLDPVMVAEDRVTRFVHQIPGAKTWSPILNTTVSHQWVWDVTIDRPDGAPARYEVTKREDLTSPRPTYGIEEKPVGDSTHDIGEFIQTNVRVEMGSFVAFVANLTGTDVLNVQGFSVAAGATQEARQIIAQPNMTTIDSSGSSVAMENVVVDAETGRLVQMYLPSDLLHDIVYDTAFVLT